VVSPQLWLVEWRRRFLCALLMGAVIALTAAEARAEAEKCPQSDDEIATDRPDVTNSSVVVPSAVSRAKTESIQARATVVGKSMAQTPAGGSGLRHAWKFWSMCPLI